MIFPDHTTVATVLVADKQRGYWRREGESNSSDRICNPACKPCDGAETLDPIGGSDFTERRNRAVSMQSGNFFPDVQGFDSLHPLHPSPRRISVFPLERNARRSGGIRLLDDIAARISRKSWRGA